MKVKIKKQPDLYETGEPEMKYCDNCGYGWACTCLTKLLDTPFQSKSQERRMNNMGNYIHKHPTGNIIFQSWEHYNRFLVHENKVNERQIKSNKDKSQSKLELPNPIEVKVKVNNVDEFIKIWDVLYPKK